MLVTTELLVVTVISEAIYEKPDGSPYLIDNDFFSEKRSTTHPGSGPFVKLKKVENEVKVF